MATRALENAEWKPEEKDQRVEHVGETIHALDIPGMLFFVAKSQNANTVIVTYNSEAESTATEWLLLQDYFDKMEEMGMVPTFPPGRRELQIYEQTFLNFELLSDAEASQYVRDNPSAGAPIAQGSNYRPRRFGLMRAFKMFRDIIDASGTRDFTIGIVVDDNTGEPFCGQMKLRRVSDDPSSEELCRVDYGFIDMDTGATVPTIRSISIGGTSMRTHDAIEETFLINKSWTDIGRTLFFNTFRSL